MSFLDAREHGGAQGGDGGLCAAGKGWQAHTAKTAAGML